MRYNRLILTLVLLLLLAACREEPEPTPPQTTAAEIAPTDEPAPTNAPPTATAVPPPTVEPTAVPLADLCVEPIYLAIIWHQHQPVYYKDPETGVYMKPWVRLHAAKDYVDMASILREYPDIKATFNLTPSLIQQLDDLGAGATKMRNEYLLVSFA